MTTASEVLPSSAGRRQFQDRSGNATRAGGHTGSRAERCLIAAVLAAAAAFYLATLRSGHRWGDDFAHYILHAKNIARGTDYAVTGYVYNAAAPEVGPPSYPPLVPLLLAPIYSRFGLDLQWMKAALLMGFFPAFLVLDRMLEPQIGCAYRAALTGMVVFHPSFWKIRDNIGSDAFFLLFLYSSLWCVARAEASQIQGKRRLHHAVLAGLLFYLASAARSAGLILVPTVCIYDLVRRKRLTSFAVVAASVCGACGMLQGAVLGVDGLEGYLGFMRLQPQSLVHALLAYVGGVKMMWSDDLRLPGLAVAAGVLALGGAGLWIRIRSGAHVQEAFVFSYTGLLLVYSIAGQNRFLIPLIPFCVLYVLLGARHVLGRLGGAGRPVSVAGLMLVALIYARQYAGAEWGPIREGLADPAFRDLCEVVKSAVRPSDIVVFRKPRLLALLSERRVAAYQNTSDTEALWNNMIGLGAAYVVLSNAARPPFTSDRFLAGAVSRYPDRLQLLYANKEFKLYRIQR